MWSWLNTASRRLEHYGSSPVVLGNQNNEGNPSVRGGTGQDDHYPEGRKEIEGVQERRKDREEERKREKFYPFATPKSRQRFPGASEHHKAASIRCNLLLAEQEQALSRSRPRRRPASALNG